MKKLVCLMIFAAMFTVSAQAAPEKPTAAPKAAAKAAKKKAAAPAKQESAPVAETRNEYPTGYRWEARKPLGGLTQPSTVK